MSRYGGGHEDFEAEKARLAALRKERESLIAKEGLYQKELDATGASEEASVRRTQVRRRARREALDVGEREVQVAGKDAEATNIDTAAIERNTAARKRAAEASRQQATAQREVARASASQDIIRHPTLYGRGGVVPGATGGDFSSLQQYGVRPDIREGGLVGGGQGRPPISPFISRAGASAAGLSEAEARHVGQLYELNARNAATAGERTFQLSRANQAAAVSFGTVSQAMHRHGALTSEFILAAARGETTLKELGNQAIVTAGKFGGWTLAASALFGAARAIGDIGKGAIAASSGVHLLQRVVTPSTFTSDQAQATFAHLSEKFNVPIDVTSDAIYRMGQRFHNFPDAARAAEAALYSFKTGEVDVATSTENLIAIVNGFGISSDKLAGVYDQINQAQNTFGIRIGDTEAGLAKAAGSFHNAGGELNYLLGIMVAIGRATNRSGQEIGTGIARSVNQLQKPQNRNLLQSLGIDVDPKNIENTYRRAIEAAQKPGADTNLIAKGLFGPQYARLIAPVLNDPRVLEQALKQTSPEASKGSAAQELKRVLAQVDEQIKSIGNALQRLGVELNNAGFFTPIGIMLKLLLGVLGAANSILDVFNKLPGPLKQGAVLMGEMAVAIQLIRKFGGGERFAGGPLGFLASPDQRLQSRATKGLGDASQEARNYQERLAAEASRIQQDAFNAQGQANIHRQTLLEGEASGKLRPLSPEHIALSEKLAVQEQEAVLLNDKAAQAQVRLTAARDAAAAAESREATVRGLPPSQVRGYLRGQGIAVPNELDSPNTAGIGYPGAGGGRHTPSREAAFSQLQFARDTGRLTPQGFNEAVARNLTARGKEVEDSLRGMGRGLQETGRSFIGLKGAGVLMEQAAGPAGKAISEAERALAAARGAPAGLKASLGKFAAGLGPLDYAFAGLIAWGALGSFTDRLDNTIDKQLTSLDEFVGNTQRSQQRMQARLAGLGQDNAGNRALDATRNVSNFLFHPFRTGEQLITGDYESPAQKRDRLSQEASQLSEEQYRRTIIQAAQRKAGGPVTSQTYDQLSASVRQDQKELRDGIISRSEFLRRLKNHAVEAKTLFLPDKQQQQAANAAYAEAARSGGSQGDYAASLAKLDTKGLQTEAQSVITTIGAFGATNRDFGHLRAAYDEAVKRWSGLTDATSIKDLAAARDLFFKGITDSTQSTLDQSLRSAPNEQARQRAYSQAQRTRAQQIVGTSRRQLADATRLLNEAENRIGQQPASPAGDLGGTQRAQTLKADEENIKNLKHNRAVLKTELAAAEKQLRDDTTALNAYEDRAAGRQSALALRQSQTPNLTQRSGDALASAAAQLRDAKAHESVIGFRKLQEAQTAYNNAQMDYAQQLLADANANNALLVARAGSDPLAQATAGLQAARNTLQVMTSHPGKFDANAVKQQQAAVITAQTQQQDAARQNAVDIASLLSQIAVARAGDDPILAAKRAQQAARQAVGSARNQKERLQGTLDLIKANNDLEKAITALEQSRYDLLKSATTDPVKQAGYDVQSARSDLRQATPGTADYNTKKAAYNRALQARTQTRIDSQRDDIEFNLEFQKISRDEAISQLELLAKTKGISKASYRDILRRIKALKDEGNAQASGFDLDVGSIKLPTIYDIRKAFDPIRGAIKQNNRVMRQQQDEFFGAKAGGGAPSFPSGIQSDVTNQISNLQDQRAQVAATINIYPSSHDAESKVYSAIDRALKTHVRANLRSHGKRGAKGVHR